MEKRGLTRKTYDIVADLWKEYRQVPDDEILERLRHYKNLTVLDLGSGTGRYISAFDKSNYVVELDYSKKMLQLNPHKLKVLADVTRLPFKKESFGLIVGFAVLHHFDDKTLVDVLKGIRDILKEGGEGIFTFWLKPELTSEEAVDIPWKKEGKKHSRYYYFYTSQRINDALKLSGFVRGKVYIDKKGRSIVLEVLK